MKKIVLSLVAGMSLLAGVEFAKANSNNQVLNVRFNENTLVVTSTHMKEAALYNLNGQMLQRRSGNFIEFPLEQGEYRLLAVIDGRTVTRRVELR